MFYLSVTFTARDVRMKTSTIQERFQIRREPLYYCTADRSARNLISDLKYLYGCWNCLKDKSMSNSINRREWLLLRKNKKKTFGIKGTEL